MKKILPGILLCLLLFTHRTARANHDSFAGSLHTIALKVPGNRANTYDLKLVPQGSTGQYTLHSDTALPLSGKLTAVTAGDHTRITVVFTASEDVYFHYTQRLATGFSHDECLFLMPGFWYRKNLRSPQEAPSFHTSDSWTVREDRLSTPLTGIYHSDGAFYSVLRTDVLQHDALTTHKEGEVIVSGQTSIGYTGFENRGGNAFLHFGYPYQETPKSYIRKLTLAPSVQAFQYLAKGQTISLNWEISSGQVEDYSDFVQHIWQYSYDRMLPRPVDTPYTDEIMKETMTAYFTHAFVGDQELKYTSGVHLRTADCLPLGQSEVGFVGRVLLNAFNALEYAEVYGREELAAQSRAIIGSYRDKGFVAEGFIREFVDFTRGTETEIYSIRRQSEGAYALLYYLKYERDAGLKDAVLEGKIRGLLDRFLALQNADGSFPRKFRADGTLVDATGGSTPSATVPLVMAYRFFKDKRYLEAARKSAEYLEREIILKSDYFSSTLDANCEDKEASLYAATAMYYLALVSSGAEKVHYTGLALKASYFALSWYYLWDVPFARGQMLGDMRMKTRGWGNVSVENNHIDVFVFEFAEVLEWLSGVYGEERFSAFTEVIGTSMRQLLPYEGHLCGVARTGYYPEVIQHTQWDYGKNGKGYYNDIFAPGWVVASLWELLTPGRAEAFLKK